MKKRHLMKLGFLFIAIIIVLLIFSLIFLENSFPTGFASLARFLNPFFLLSSVGRMFITIDFQLIIDSPQNITYNFNKSNNYTISLNVSSNRNITSWRYTLEDLRHGTIVNESVSFSPNTTINAVRWSNKLTVYANDSAGNSKNQSIVFYVNVSTSSPIIDNISDIYVCEASFLSYLFGVSDVDEDNLSASLSPQYPFSPFYISYSSPFNLTRHIYEIFSGILSKNDAGGVNSGSETYNENVYVSDGIYSDSTNFNITVIEINNAPSIANIGTKTVWTRGDNRTFNYKVNASDIESGNQDSGNLSFNLSFSGVNLFNISSNGVINFSANSTELGVYNISVCVSDLALANPHPNISLCSQDGTNRTSCRNFSLTVTNQNRYPNITSYYPLNLSFNANGTQILAFNITTYDPDWTVPDVYWYVDNSLKEYDAGNLINTFFYSMGCGVSGEHSVKVEITDGELNDSINWTVNVTGEVCPEAVSSVGIGGGLSKIIACTEKWGCEEWSQCKNLKKSIGSGEANYIPKSLIEGRCSLFSWKDAECGYQTRNCQDVNKCSTNLTKPGILRECYYTEFPTCYDGILNCHNGLCEILADCGGACPPCPTCSDKIKNQDEEDIDCGGPCPECKKEIPMPPKIRKIIAYFFLSLFTIALVFIVVLVILYTSKKKEIEKIKKRFKTTK